MTDPISTLRGLCHDSQRRDEELRRGFAEFEQMLTDTTEGVDAHGSSDYCSLQTYGDDEAIYGYLYFRKSSLRIAHRSTEDDLPEPLNDNHGERTFSVSLTQDCCAVWLRALAAPAIVESLVTSITEGTRASVDAATAGVRVLAATANLPVRDLESAFVGAAESLNYRVVLEDWRHAQAALGVNPADAATRACQLLESLCTHILETRSQQVPVTQTIQKLFKAVARYLELSPDQQSSRDLQTIASGIFSIAQGVGSLRTHAGTAHGGGENRHEATFPEARLAVNSAGAVATFLMGAFRGQPFL